MKELLRKMWRDDNGQDVVEYALIAGLVSVIAYLAITAAGQSVNTIWNTVSTDLNTAAGGQ